MRSIKLAAKIDYQIKNGYEVIDQIIKVRIKINFHYNLVRKISILPHRNNQQLASGQIYKQPFVNSQLCQENKLPVTKSTLIINYFRYPSKMKQKSSTKKKQSQSQSEHSEPFTVNKIHSQTTTPKQGTCYLVEFKNMPSESQWVWKQEQELMGVKGFKKEVKKFLSTVGRPTEGGVAKSGMVPQTEQKKPAINNLTNIGGYEVDKELIREKLKMAIANKQQQGSLESFVKLLPKQQSSQHKPQVEPTLPTKPIKSQKQSQATNPLTKLEQQKTTAPAPWIDKIKAIKTIKGYQVKNDEISYEVDVWDKNGQAFFVPPLSSQTVKKIDEVKLAMFLQDCLIQEWQQVRAMEKQ